MKFSNECLIEEKIWYNAIKSIHAEIEKELADNLSNLSVDGNGVLDKKVSEKAMLFNEKKIRAKFEETAKKLISGTMEKFGSRAMVEAENAKK